MPKSKQSIPLYTDIFGYTQLLTADETDTNRQAFTPYLRCAAVGLQRTVEAIHTWLNQY